MIDPDAFLMTLAEARQVHWLKNNPRPLGELYDEGYLDKARLEWAVAKAYSPRLRRAAMVLLKEALPPALEPAAAAGVEVAGLRSPSPDSPLSGSALAEAEVTPWPFPPCKGEPMGSLVETRRLSLKDLGYAAENAWEPRVRRAAAALMKRRLGQQVAEPDPSAGFVKWFSGGSSFAHRRQMQINLLEGLVMGALLGALLTAFSIFLFSQPTSFYSSLSLATLLQNPTAIVGLMLLILILGIILFSVLTINRLLNRLDHEIENYRKGDEGEQKTVEVILQNLDGAWTLFRNLRLPGRSRADLDAVLVGPAGVWALEVMNLSGQYRNTGEKWEYRHKNRWSPYRSSPSRQASTAAARLGGFLKADGVKAWVQPAIVWADEACLPLVENPSVAVWPLERLPDELGNLWQEEKLAPDTRAHIVEKLTRLCDKK